MNVWSESRSVVSNSVWPHGLYSPWNSPDQNTGVSGLFLLQGIFPTQGSNPGLPHCRWILNQLSRKQSPRILEWVAYPFYNWGLLNCRFFINWSMREGPDESMNECKKAQCIKIHLELRKDFYISHLTGYSG